MDLSQATKEIIPISELFLDMEYLLDININKATFRWTIFEDNQGCIDLVWCPRMSPRTKHIAIKYNHFWDDVSRKVLYGENIHMVEKSSDIFMKTMNREELQYLRR